jgi:hypothetical protein
MNELLKNLNLSYQERSSRHFYGAMGIYPTDHSFIRAWESADYIEDVSAKFDHDVTQALKKEIESKLKMIESCVSELRAAGSLEKYFKNKEHVGYSLGQRKGNIFPGGVNGNVVAFYRKDINRDRPRYEHQIAKEISYCQNDFRGFSTYYIYKDFLEVLAEAEARLTEAQEDLKSLTISCYKTPTNRNNLMRDKKKVINRRYSIDLKKLTNRPVDTVSYKTQAHDLMQRSRDAFKKYKEALQTA